MTNGDGGEMPDWALLWIGCMFLFVFGFGALIAWDRHCTLQSNLALVEAAERAMLRQVEITEGMIKGMAADPLPCE